jgi:hypothetical protein
MKKSYRHKKPQKRFFFFHSAWGWFPQHQPLKIHSPPRTSFSKNKKGILNGLLTRNNSYFYSSVELFVSEGSN